MLPGCFPCIDWLFWFKLRFCVYLRHSVVMVAMKAIKTGILKRPVGGKAACATGVVKLAMTSVNANQSDELSTLALRDPTQSDDAS